jgi:capsular polysaccharide biosynthesis protein
MKAAFAFFTVAIISFFMCKPTNSGSSYLLVNMIKKS